MGPRLIFVFTPQVVGLRGVPSAPPCALVHAPLAVTPAPLPAAAFAAAVDAAPAFNQLAAAVSRDAEWTATTLARAAAADDFTSRLLSVAAGAAATGPGRRPGTELDVLLSRSDYLIDAGWEADGGDGAATTTTPRALQVELNTIASSFGCLATATSTMHATLAARAGWDDEARARLPANNARAALASGLAAAAQEHARGARLPAPGAALFVVQPGEANAYDQAALAACLTDDHGVTVIRATLADVAAKASVAPADGALLYDNQRISLVYYRAGYAPTDYQTETEWTARALLESSDAALCPSARLQLAGTKMVQAALAAPGATERFVAPAAAAACRAVYAGLWRLDALGTDPNVDEAVTAAQRAPHLFVLKPQREGGGNNVYGADLATALSSWAPCRLAAYVLMERMRPAPHTTTLVRAGVAAEGVACLSELGVFGVLVARGDKVLLNAPAGHLLRTKPVDADEGGVASGYAVLDSPYLV